MTWSRLGAQFCHELGFGVLLALAFVPRAPVGVLFYRLMGTTALAAVLAATALLRAGDAAWGDPALVAGLAALVAYPVYSGPVRGGRWGAALGLALAGCAAAVVFDLRAAGAASGAGLALAAATALATGAVAGSVGLAMVLGHWYLTVPNLAVGHLRRLNRVTVASMLASLLFVCASAFAHGDELEHALLGPTGLFHLGTRVAVGLVFPLGFAWMTASSLRFGNTRSATGILYASTVLVLIGTAASIALQDAYGVPL